MALSKLASVGASKCVASIRLLRLRGPVSITASTPVSNINFLSWLASNQRCSYRTLHTSSSENAVKSALAEVPIPDVPITEFVFKDFKRFGDRPALINGVTGQSLTFPQVHDAIWRVASGLTRHGLKKNDVVMILSENCIEYIIAFHAIISIGGTVTMANPQYLPVDIANQVKDSGALYLMSSKRCSVKALEVNIMAQSRIKKMFIFGEEDGCVPFSSLLLDDGSSFPANVDIDVRNHVALLPYSSGTTGLPKGVMLTHFTQVANTQQSDSDAIMARREGVVQLGMLPFYHIFAIQANLITSLAWGQTSVILPGFEPKLFLETIAKYKINMTYIVPPIILFLNRHPLVAGANLSSLQRIISGAAPLGKDIIDEFHIKQPQCSLGQAYGLTETAPGISVNPIWSSKSHPSSCGVPISMTEIKIMNTELGSECELNDVGEIFVRGPQVMMGYLNNLKATQDMIDPQGWLKTGDIGYLDKDNYLYICDRVKELIKYKGLQVAPAELEAIICAHPAVADAGVVGVADPEAGEVPKAFIALKKGATLNADQLQDFVNERVVGFKKLRGGVEFIAEIPRSAAGKILRRELKALLKK